MTNQGHRETANRRAKYENPNQPQIEQPPKLQQAVIANQNVFNVLMDAVRCCSLGQITNALFEVGGQYRRSM